MPQRTRMLRVLHSNGYTHHVWWDLLYCCVRPLSSNGWYLQSPLSSGSIRHHADRNIRVPTLRENFPFNAMLGSVSEATQLLNQEGCAIAPHWCFREMCCFHLQSRRKSTKISTRSKQQGISEDGDSVLLRNISELLAEHTASRLRRQLSINVILVMVLNQRT
jgi:hypothetical protein